MSAVLQSTFPLPNRPRPAVGAVKPSTRVAPRANLTRVSILIGIFVSLFVVRLFISVAIDSSAYQIATLGSQSANLTRDAAFLDEQLEVLNSPQNLSTVARKLGMVNNNRPAYLRLSDGRVWGDPHTVGNTVKESSPIANHLIGTLGDVPKITGVANNTTKELGSESKPSSQAASGTKGIPAPNTH